MAAPNPEKQPIPPQGEQYYPPPPPGPPPSQSGQQHYAPPPGAPPSQASYGQQQHTAPTHSSNYPIPEYNPANPQFAPPINDTINDPTPSKVEQQPPPSPGDPAKKQGWSERLQAMGMKAADPINALANKLGSQSFLPTTLDKECEKAAAILRQFCKEGVETDGDYPGATTGTTGTTVPGTADPTVDDKGKHQKHDKTEKPQKTQKPQKALVKIPSKVIAKAQGLAIFTTARIGFHISGATGSGVVLARLPDGSWGPPSGIQVLSVGAGFLIGADIYDCVCVINNKEALEAFTNSRVSLGSDLAVAAGPYGAGGALDVGRALASEKPDGTDRHGNPTPQTASGTTPATTTTPAPGTTAPTGTAAQTTPADDSRLQADKKLHKRSSSASLTKPVFYYVKSRGLYAGVAIDGTAINERKEANAAFYGASIPVAKILKGEVPQTANASWQASVRALHEVLRAAETGKRASYNAGAVPTGQQTATQPQGQQGYQQQPSQVPGQQSVPQHDNKPGFVSVPLQRQEYPAQNLGQPQHQGYGAAPTFPPPPGSTAQGAAASDTGAPPAYVDDGKPHTGTGDQKVSYQ